MNTILPEHKSPHVLMWIAGIAVIIFSIAGIAAIMGWIPTSLGRTSDNGATSAPARLPADKSARVDVSLHNLKIADGAFRAKS
ncbi:MAG: hypothetical protein JWN94_2244 [Betaproteobacteria bacterium]|nr:hypothetical protein [Betaproteobacteria bacterium]